MGPKLGHEADVIDTVARREHEHNLFRESGDSTHVDSTNPFCFLMCTECSPFSAYSRLRAGAVFIRVWPVNRGPKGGQSEGKEPQDEHS
jgi:hypothetical protein